MREREGEKSCSVPRFCLGEEDTGEVGVNLARERVLIEIRREKIFRNVGRIAAVLLEKSKGIGKRAATDVWRNDFVDDRAGVKVGSYEVDYYLFLKSYKMLAN